MKTHKIVLTVLVFAIISLLQSIATAVESHPWDVNQDGVVDKADLDIICNNFGSKNASSDVNSDGIVNILDLVLVVKHFEETYDNTIIGKDGAPMILIPAGEFQMGDSLDIMSNALPVHTVYFDAFYIDVYEVTNAQYKRFMDATGYKAPSYWNDPNYNAYNNPVVGVSWDDAKAYADWAGERLPTEAEWEKSARGGFVGKSYPWGDILTHDDANYARTGGKDIWNYTSPVGSFAPNGYGLYDMAGNVWEWCADWYNFDDNYYANSPKSNPTGASSGQYRVLRGGSWYGYYAYYYFLTASRHFYYPPLLSYNNIGFRCVQ